MHGFPTGFPEKCPEHKPVLGDTIPQLQEAGKASMIDSLERKL